MYINLLVLLCVHVSQITGTAIDFPLTECDSEEICVEIRKCPFFDELLNKSTIPRPRSVINVIRKNQCRFLNNMPYVCCRKNKAPSEVESKAREDSLPIYEPITDEVTRHKNLKLLRNDICGPILTNSRITSGKKTALQEFPWMAIIAYYTEAELDFRCGGTVINERYVLTAAHCILNSSIIGVRLGEHNLGTSKDCAADSSHCAPPTQDFYIQEAIVHPEYDPKTLVNDIALIRLATPANFNVSNVKPICLPVTVMDLIGKFVLVSGWGLTETGHNSAEMLKTTIPVLPISLCRRRYKHFAPVTSNQICAGGYKGRDSCGGDSGGPMKYVGLVDGTARYIQYGIVSYGPKHCGADGQPGIYTNVSRYIKWILDNLKPNED